jgi:ATP-dependent exoDNAse (exonuclease V) beta subunit
VEEREQKTIFDLPKGPQAGSAVHEIFEKITFSSDINTIRRTVETTMKKYGWDEE